MNSSVDKERHGSIPKGEDKVNSKLTEELVIYVRQQASSGRSYASLGNELGLIRSSIGEVVRRET